MSKGSKVKSYEYTIYRNTGAYTKYIVEENKSLYYCIVVFFSGCICIGSLAYISAKGLPPSPNHLKLKKKKKNAENKFKFINKILKVCLILSFRTTKDHPQ